MAFENLGLSFLPQGDSGGGAGDTPRLEDVLRVLSFRLPRILGARPIAPGQLLSEGPRNAGNPLGGALAQGVLQNMPGAPMPPTDPGAPSPLSQLFAPVFGPGTAGVSQPLPSSSGRTTVIPIEPPPSGPPTRDRRFEDNFDSVSKQLGGGRRRLI